MRLTTGLTPVRWCSSFADRSRLSDSRGPVNTARFVSPDSIQAPGSPPVRSGFLRRCSHVHDNYHGHVSSPSCCPSSFRTASSCVPWAPPYFQRTAMPVLAIHSVDPAVTFPMEAIRSLSLTCHAAVRATPLKAWFWPTIRYVHQPFPEARPRPQEIALHRVDRPPGDRGHLLERQVLPVE